MDELIKELSKTASENTAVTSLVELVIRLAIAIILYYVGKKVVKIILKIIDKAFEKSGTELSLRRFLHSLIRLLLYIVLAMIIVDMIGLKTSSFIAIFGSAGLTIGLALQGSLSNFAGGVLILILKPFKVGDYIIEDTKGNEGTVQSIDVFYTRLLTVDNKVVSVPNGTLANSSLTNVTSQNKRRIDMVVPVSYTADIRLAKDILKTIIDGTEEIMRNEPVDIFVSELGESSVNLGLRVWLPTESYWKVKWRITEQIKYAFDENGIEIPYNKLDVNIINKN